MTVPNTLEETKALYIPKHLVYEELNGRKLYRKGYKQFLNQTKTIEEIWDVVVCRVLLSLFY